MWRLAEDCSETADEMRLGDVGNRRDRADVEWLRISAVHRVARAQQAPVQIFGVPAHAATLRHQARARRAAGHALRRNLRYGSPWTVKPNVRSTVTAALLPPSNSSG